MATAWLQWRLRGDPQAAKTFVGADCGLCANEGWTIMVASGNDDVESRRVAVTWYVPGATWVEKEPSLVSQSMSAPKLAPLSSVK